MEMILDGSCDLLEYYGDSPEVTGIVLPGDVRKTLELLDDQSVQCVVTSPPYWSLRDYGIDGQIGLTESMYSYIEELNAVFLQVKRVLRDDGTLWLTVTATETASGILRTQALACLVLTCTALDSVTAVGLAEADGDVLHAPMTAADLALTDPATDTP